MEMIKASETHRRNWPNRLWGKASSFTEVLFSKATESLPPPGLCSAAKPDLWPPCGDSCSCSFSCREDQQNVKSKMPSCNTWSVAEVDRFLKYMLLNQMWQAAESQRRGQTRKRRTGALTNQETRSSISKNYSMFTLERKMYSRCLYIADWCGCGGGGRAWGTWCLHHPQCNSTTDSLVRYLGVLY